MKWYVLQVKTGNETAIRDDFLRREIKSLVPRHVIYERRQGKNFKVERNLFPSYVFVEVDFSPKIYYQLKQTAGVIRWLGTNGPEPVPEEEMHHIFLLCGAAELAGISSVIRSGDRIKVLYGPLQGFEGQIIKVDYRKLRAKVRLTLFGKPCDLNMGIEILKASE